MNNQIKWMKQLDKVHTGQAMTCPQCGSTHTVAALYRFSDGVGYGDLSCKDCGDSAHISRMKFPEGTKAEIIDVE